ncbi:AzlC family ABC transporter permease [Xenorhabdus bharatensis]|uniref:AzlC family ABC transporter permease n=1 Tax=Xenorhabdus bharatensis TaxID=3136256 RepID=UPI0030F43613
MQSSLFRKGMLDSLPVCISFFLIFASVGALYQNKGLSLIEAMVGSVFTFAAPLQVAVVNYLANGALLSVIILTLIINFRFFLMSMVMSQYFHGISKSKVVLSMLAFSASTYTVTHAHLVAEKIPEGKAQFNYYLGVSVPSFVIAVLATLLGYVSSDYLNYDSISLFLVMLIPIHFSSLTAKRAGKDLSVFATLVGGLCAPFINELNIQLMDIAIPIIVGMCIAFYELKIKKGA